MDRSGNQADHPRGGGAVASGCGVDLVAHPSTKARHRTPSINRWQPSSERHCLHLRSDLCLSFIFSVVCPFEAWGRTWCALMWALAVLDEGRWHSLGCRNNRPAAWGPSGVTVYSETAGQAVDGVPSKGAGHNGTSRGIQREGGRETTGQRGAAMPPARWPSPPPGGEDPGGEDVEGLGVPPEAGVGRVDCDADDAGAATAAAAGRGVVRLGMMNGNGGNTAHFASSKKSSLPTGFLFRFAFW